MVGLSPTTAIDFGGDHWVIVRGTAEEVMEKLGSAFHAGDVVVKFTRQDGSEIWVFTAHVKLVGPPAGTR